MSWLILVLAGLLEIVWAVGLKLTDGFTRPIPSTVVAVAIIASMILLAIAAKSLPIGTAYAVWVGIGAFGTALVGILYFDEPATPARIVFLALLLAAIIGLKLTSDR